EKMLVVVLNSEYMAYKGAAILKQLDEEGSISVHAAAIIEKISDRKVTILQTKEEFPIRTIEGTAIGSLIGLLGGPLGVLVGAASGVVLGDIGDLHRSGVNTEFVNDVSSKLAPGKYAVVADISEEDVTQLDTRMAELGGQVFRTRKRYVEIDQIKANLAALNADIAQLNKEMKNAGKEQKANLQAKIEKLKEKRQKEIVHAKGRFEQRERERDIKVLALKEKAANARGKTKAAIEARMAQINSDYKKTLTKWKNLEAERLEKRADRLQEKARQLRSQ
ncbi:MAG TPA: DUF1269 domain-containing protein, partial [candidate division Zixibacteria bacterium]|nr:DUF1269 domain-containing protein [candidate division Zixibacteria bacterium]